MFTDLIPRQAVLNDKGKKASFVVEGRFKMKLVERFVLYTN